MIRLASVAVFILLLLLTTVVQPATQELRPPRLGDDRLVGLKWTFVRIRYSSDPGRLQQFRQTYWSDPWIIDGPVAEQISLAGWRE